MIFKLNLNFLFKFKNSCSKELNNNSFKDFIP